MKLEIEDGPIAELVMGAIAKVAKSCDAAIDAHEWGNLGATEQDYLDWKATSDKLWAIVRQFSVPPG